MSGAGGLGGASSGGVYGLSDRCTCPRCPQCGKLTGYSPYQQGGWSNNQQYAQSGGAGNSSPPYQGGTNQ